MKSIKGTQTEKNMRAAFAGESQARNKYSFYEEQARKEGCEDVAKIFERMGKNEMMHARIWYKILNEGIGETSSNLQDAARGENGEWRSMYPNFAKKAREEGLDEIADMFERVAAIEEDHERTFLKALISMSKKSEPAEEIRERVKTFKQVPVYRCMFCGAVFEETLDVCPVCEAIGSFEREYTEKEVEE